MLGHGDRCGMFNLNISETAVPSQLVQDWPKPARIQPDTRTVVVLSASTKAATHLQLKVERMVQYVQQAKPGF